MRLEEGPGRVAPVVGSECQVEGLAIAGEEDRWGWELPELGISSLAEQDVHCLLGRLAPGRGELGEEGVRFRSRSKLRSRVSAGEM